MVWEFSDDRPIYMQIIEHIQRGIVSGVYPPGSGMPSVRVLALEAEVNPNTMQRALAELESMGLLNTQRASGRTVTKDGSMVDKLKKELANAHISNYFTGMNTIGIEKEDAVNMLSKAAGEVK